MITDSVPASGLPDGEFTIGGLVVVVKDNIARLKSNGALAGGTTPYWQALKNIYKLTGLPLKKLIKTTGYNQAQELGLEKTGKIEPGFYADIAVLDANFKPMMVFVNGKQKL
jgi:N-acetylglucosamine-6-phosphate deacetylase